MFKSIVSKFHFGKAVFSRITAFIGGIIGIKPETVEIPAPPEIENSVNNTAPEATESEEKEGLIKKAFKTAKKAVVTAIKAVFTFIADVLNFLFDMLIICVIVASVVGLGLITAYGINYALVHLGIIALAITLWETQGVAQITLLVLALIGVTEVNFWLATIVWHLILKPIHIFLWSILLRDVSKRIIPIDTTNADPIAKNINLEFFNGVYKKEEILTVVDSRPTKEPAMTMKIIEVPVSSVEKVSETATTNEVKDVDIFDSTPVVIEIEEILPEIVPAVIEIEEIPTVVDSRPTKESRQDELNKLKISELKAIVREINKQLPASNRIGSRGEKIAIINRIILAEQTVSDLRIAA